MNADISYLLKIEGETLPVQGNLTIGRHIDNDVIVAGEDVLDFHLRLELNERGPLIIPLGNATFALNGNEVEGTWSLIPGDVIGIGVVAVHVGVEREQADGIRAWVLADQDSERIHDVVGDLLIGRHPECGLQLDSEHVSRRHARIVQVAGALWIQDLGSANGTQLNGRTIRGGCRLFHGDEVRFDEIAFRVRGIGEDLTSIRLFRDEDLRPIRVIDGSAPSDPSSVGRALVPRIESSIEKHGMSQRSGAAAASVSRASAAAIGTAQSTPNQKRAFEAQRQPVLEGMSDARKGQFYPLVFGRSRIGTALACEVRIEHPSLAEVHAEIVIRPEQTTLTAVGGIGTTLVNLQPVVVMDLSDGDLLRLGDAEFVYHAAPASGRQGVWANRWVRVGGVVLIVLVVSVLLR